MKKAVFSLAFIGLLAFGAVGAAAQKNSAWSGVWKVPSRFAPSTLSIKKASATSFQFELDAMNGANMGDISGVARISGKKAYFDDSNSKDKNSRYGCRLTFTNRGAFIAVDMSAECLNYAGNGVYFGGEYYRGNPKVVEDNFVVLEVFPDAGLDRKFKTLVGADYERFLDSFHLVSEGEDADGLGTKVFDACVRGMCPFWAGIIMYDRQGNLWAMVLIDDAANEKLSAHYYTSAAGWTEKLPKTLEKWFEEKNRINDGKISIVYKSKK